MKIFVFIFISKRDGSFYFGQSLDVFKTLQLHNSGYSQYTKRLMPWDLFAYKIYDNRTDALRAEMELRTTKTKAGVLKFMLYNEFQIYREEQ